MPTTPGQVISPPSRRLRGEAIVGTVGDTDDFFVFPPSLLLSFTRGGEGYGDAGTRGSPLFHSGCAVARLPLSGRGTLPGEDTSLRRGMLLVRG